MVNELVPTFQNKKRKRPFRRPANPKSWPLRAPTICLWLYISSLVFFQKMNKWFCHEWKVKTLYGTSMRQPTARSTHRCFFLSKWRQNLQPHVARGLSLQRPWAGQRKFSVSLIEQAFRFPEWSSPLWKCLTWIQLPFITGVPWRCSGQLCARRGLTVSDSTGATPGCTGWAYLFR